MSLKTRVAALLTAVFGRFSWEAPAWAKGTEGAPGLPGRLAGALQRHWRVLAGLVLVAGAGGGGWYWYSTRPQPVRPEILTLSATTHGISAPSRRQRGEPVPPPQLVVVTFSGSAAPLDQINKVVSAGVAMSPRVDGEWRWVTERALAFTPKAAWPIGASYSVTLEPSLVSRPNLVLETRHLEFTTEEFRVVRVNTEFYQDPVDPSVKQIVGTYRFNYPVDAASFEKNLSLTSAPMSNTGQKTPVRYSVAYDDYRYEAYVRSVSLPMPLENHQATMELAAGTRPEAPGKAFSEALSGTTTIPGKGDRFKVQSASVGIARSAEGDPDQVLVFACTSPVNERVFAGAVKAWVLPKTKPAAQGAKAVPDYHWYDAREVGPEVLKKATRLNVTAIPGEHETGEVQSFKLDAKPASQVFVRVEAGVEAFGGYVLLKPFEAIVEVPEYPRELRLAHEGAILSVTGDKKLTVTARGIPGFRVQLFRVMPKDLNHLMTQSSGNFAHLSMRGGGFGEENVSEVFTEIQKLDASDPKTAQYAAIDFGPHLKEGNEQRGLYFVTVNAWDPATNTEITQYTRSDERETPQARPPAEGEGFEAVDKPEEGAEGQPGMGEGESEGDGEGYHGEGEGEGEGGRNPYGQLSDKRFVLLTDLGMIDKVDPAGSHWVYAQSFRSGAPVAGAQLEVLAKNGTVVMRKTTDATGVATLPPLNDLQREKQAVALVLRDGQDVSFLPLSHSTRLDFSRFDVGGVRTRGKGSALNAYAFSDRGLYRPGETAHLSALVRAVEWARGMEGVPLELTVTDPRGLNVKLQRVKLDKFGFTSLDFTPEESAPTGTYSFTVSVAEPNRSTVQLGSVSFRVEEFLPDQMHMTSRFVDKSPGWVTGQKLSAAVELKNLFGTPAAGHTVQASFSLSPWSPRFSKYPDYQFFDPAEAKRSEEQRLEELQTDDQGNATWKLDLSSWAPSTWQVTFYAEGMALGGGRSVSSVATVIVSPRKYLVGFKADGDLGFIKRGVDRKVELIAVDPALEKIKADKLKAVLVEQRYVSVLTRESSGSFRYQSVLKDVTRKSEPLAIAAGGSKLSLPDADVGSFYLSIRDQEDVELLRIPYTIAGDGNVAKDLERNAELKISLDKPDYEPGDTISVQVSAPYAGAGIITIERDKVYAHKSFKTTTTTSVQTIEVPAGLEANGYVQVAFVRSLDSPELYTSPLSYGVVPFSISKKNKLLQVTVTADALSRPGRPLAIHYQTDKPSRLALFAVDEGILQVAHYDTPDPLSFFLARRALEVSTLQIVDLLLPEFRLVHGKGKEGGDDDAAALAKNLNPFKRKADKPAVFWSGIVDAGPEDKTVTFDVPESFNGSLRIMAVAAAPEALGATRASTTIRGPFVISPNTPMFASPKDSLVVTAAIANNVEGSGDKASVTVELKPNAAFTVVGQATQTLSIPEGREAVATFQVTVTDSLGAGELRFHVAGAKQEATRTAHLSVRPSSPYMVNTQAGTLKDKTVDLKTTRKMFDQLSTREVTVSLLPLGIGSAVVEYLDNYPHLCSEQLSSRAAPALIFMKRPEWGYDPVKAKAAFDRAFGILRARQNENGEFGYWAANSFVSDPLDVYITLMLTEAKERGALQPNDVRQKAIGMLKRVADRPLSDLGTAELRAQALYVLARNEVVMPAPTAQLAEFLSRSKDLGPARDLALTYLAGTYKLTHNADHAQALMDKVTTSLAPNVKPDAHYYWDDLSYRAQILYVLSKHFPERLNEVGPGLLELMAARLGSMQSLNAAWALYALDAYATAVTADTKATLASVTLQEVDAKGQLKALELKGALVSKVRFDGATTGFKLQSKDGALAFYSLTEAGFDRDPPTLAMKEGVELIHTLEDSVGRELTKVKLGDEVTVHLRTRSLIANRTLSQMAVVDMLPSGFDVVLAQGSNAQGMARLVSGDSSWTPTELDVREDRVIFYGDVRPEVGDVKYKIKAVSRGKFVLPPSYTNGMYEASLKGRSAAGSIEVE